MKKLVDDGLRRFGDDERLQSIKKICNASEQGIEIYQFGKLLLPESLNIILISYIQILKKSRFMISYLCHCGIS